jgi:glycosyltransferase involved in cell wall biosynthesis
MRILFLTAEQWPTFRADLTVLFGKYLPRFGVKSDLVTEQEVNDHQALNWPAGHLLLCTVPRNRAGQYVVKFLHQCKVLMRANYQHYDAIQVRDMTLVALVALAMAKLKAKPFYYWLSYPQSEGQIHRSKARGMRAGMRYFFPLIQGLVGQWLLYRVILPNASHVFVQSQTMLDMIASKGIAPTKMTPVPMGVDLEAIEKGYEPIRHPAFANKRVLVYLGTLDRTRQIEVLFNMMVHIRQTIPNVLLVLVGDTEDAEHRNWLKQEAQRLEVADSIHWTGWLPTQEAWRYVVAAEIGLSPIPRGDLLDMGSPTKAVEYMALNIPVVMNDNPDQAQVAKESDAALCVPLTPESFAQATLQLLNDADTRAGMRQKGLAYVTQVRGYAQLASNLYQTYYKLISKLS